MDDTHEVWPTVPESFYAALINKELRCPSRADPRERRLCVTWIVRACHDYGFRAATAGLAVKYFDAFMTSARKQVANDPEELTFKQVIVKVGGAGLCGEVTRKESQICELICICTIAIAAKKLEPKEKAPYLGDFDENFSFEELRCMEMVVLKALDWNINYSTPHDYVHFYLPRVARRVDKKAILPVMQEALATCMKEGCFVDMPANVFGAAATLWAHLALQEKDETVEEWEVTLARTIHSNMEEVHVAVESIGEVMKPLYPHAYKPHRAASPADVLDLSSMIGFSNAQPASNPIACAGKGTLKRPKAERRNSWSPCLHASSPDLSPQAQRTRANGTTPKLMSMGAYALGPPEDLACLSTAEGTFTTHVVRVLSDAH